MHDGMKPISPVLDRIGSEAPHYDIPVPETSNHLLGDQ